MGTNVVDSIEKVLRYIIPGVAFFLLFALYYPDDFDKATVKLQNAQLIFSLAILTIGISIYLIHKMVVVKFLDFITYSFIGWSPVNEFSESRFNPCAYSKAHSELLLYREKKADFYPKGYAFYLWATTHYSLIMSELLIIFAGFLHDQSSSCWIESYNDMILWVGIILGTLSSISFIFLQYLEKNMIVTLKKNEPGYKKKAGNNVDNKEKNSFFQGILVPAIVSIIVATITTLIATFIQAKYERPDLKIVGALPIHLFGSLKGPSDSKFRIHKLALIIKIENSSPTPVMAHMAMFGGCTEIPPLVADSQMPKNDQLESGINIKAFYEKYKNSVQKVSGFAIIRPDSQILQAHTISYIGAIFPLAGQSAYHSIDGTVSLKGDCTEINVSNPHPAISQVFDIKRIHYDLPKGLRKEFKNGDLSIKLFVGSEQLSVPSKLLKPLKSLKIERWEELALPQMYENPDTSFPPLKKYE